MDAQGFDIKPHEELIYEIRRGHRQIYKALIDSGANINYQNNINETPLTVALYRNDFDAIKELVNAGADINFKNRYGSTILTTAASLGKIEAVTLLINPCILLLSTLLVKPALSSSSRALSCSLLS